MTAAQREAWEYLADAEEYAPRGTPRQALAGWVGTFAVGAGFWAALVWAVAR